MAQKDRVLLPTYFPGQSATGTITGAWIHIDGIDNISLLLAWTGATTFTVAVNVSNDPVKYDGDSKAEPSGSPGGSPLTLPAAMTGQQPTGGGAGNLYWDFNQLAAKWIQFVITVTVAAGNVAGAVHGKAI